MSRPPCSSPLHCHFLSFVLENESINSKRRNKMNLLAAVKTILSIFKFLPVNTHTLFKYIRQHYGPIASDFVFQLRKSRLKVKRLEAELHFLKKCKEEFLLPTFVQFHVPSTHKHRRGPIEQCRRAFLLDEIKCKKQQLTTEHRHHNVLRTDTIATIKNRLIIIRTESLIRSFVQQQQHAWTTTHDRKLELLRQRQRGIPRDPLALISTTTAKSTHTPPSLPTSARITHAASPPRVISTHVSPPPPSPTTWTHPQYHPSLTPSGRTTPTPTPTKPTTTTTHGQPISSIHIQPVKNFSKRHLTKEEEDILTLGLDYVHPSTNFDQETFISNMECLFVNLLGHCTDKRDYEEVDPRNPIEYKMTPHQLQYATKLRRLCDTFQHQTTRTPVNRARTKQQAKILQSLMKDKTIYVTQPDKEKGVVIMDRNEYINKMKNIINDQNTFKQIPIDPTIKQEDRLNRKLRQLKETGFIKDDEYNFSRASGSQPARIYGLPKIHKDGRPLRPILSASGTYNYKLTKLLVHRLSHLRKHETIITDTFTFVDHIRKLNIDMSKHRMISFDVINLFTNIPLQETIRIILDELYGESCECETTTPSATKMKSKPCEGCLNRTNMKWLLETATTGTHFHFNGEIYQQTNGVAMGSPLAPLLADIFLIHLEKQVMNKLEDSGVVFWKRYVDDTFVIIRDNTDADRLNDILNQVHPAIQFTKEEEKDFSLPFLDIRITRNPVHQHEKLATTVYRKPTFSGLMLKWSSFVPTHYKKSAVSSMIYRAIRLCSTYTSLHQEFLFIKRIALANGYPINVIEQQIRKTLTRYVEPKRQNNEVSPTERTTSTPPENTKEKIKKRIVLVDIPFVGRPTSVFGKQLINLANHIDPRIKLQPIARPPPATKTFFPRKDPIPKQLQSRLVYKIQCNECSASYIGKTIRQAARRLPEHGACLHELTTDSNACQNSGRIQPPEESPRRRRSDRIKNKTVTNLRHPPPTQTRTTQQPEQKGKSAILHHQTTLKHEMDWKGWKIVAKEPHPYRLLIRESLAIVEQQPELNRTINSAPLIIFPEGTNGRKPKMKDKQINPSAREGRKFS